MGGFVLQRLLRDDLPVLAGLLADTAHAWLDPQVRFGTAAGR
jgi:hypothetical protein